MEVRTYNDKQIAERSRSVYMRALELADAELSKEAINSEKLHAIAATADAASAGFAPEEDDGDESSF